MRLSTATFQNNAVAQMDALEEALQKTQTQLSTGVRIQSAADDPTGMAQVNQLNVQISASTQYVTNSNTAQTNLELEEQALTNASNVMQNANTLAVEANNSALSAANKHDIATQLQQDLQSLISIANSTDGNGNYLFGGYANTTAPFTQSGGSVSYNGTIQVTQVQISSNQSVSTGDNGNAAFMNIPNGNGTFQTAAAGTNTGSASIGGGTITDASQWVPDTYTISFTDASNYTVTDGAGNTVSSGTYTNSGDSISFNGAQVALNGTPAAGDQFTVSPSTTTSVFSALSNLIASLNSSATINSGQLTSLANTAVQQIQNSITNFSNVSASVGARLNAITAAQTSATSIQTNLKTNVGTLQNTDYTAATTQLSTEELALQAAQESYASLEKLSLFNYIQG